VCNDFEQPDWEAEMSNQLSVDETGAQREHPRRFHLRHAHLEPVFGGDWFALRAEAFARFFGTPLFLVA
jgi:hypothetical protein